MTAASKRAWQEARETHDYLPERLSANTTYGTFAWQERIGFLLPDDADRWWTIERGRPTEQVAVDVLDAIGTHVLPAIRERTATPEPER